MKYKSVVGLEIHVELKTKSKMFCSCLNDSDEKKPNVNICPVCTAQPGSLPVINKEAVRKVIKTGLSLDCQIPEHSQFDRKNYFYPDLPKGYQISQLYQPFCKKGFLEIDGKKIKIREVHLEEDTGKLIHPEGADYSLVDFNRSGVPLMELVTEPDITSAKEARKFAQDIQLIVRYLDVSQADMEKGQMRVEANISIGKNKKLGTKVEIKNLNSFRTVERGIDYEIKRQTEILEDGKEILQETRGWDDIKEKTFSQREKEFAHDYRYFPEPDLPPLHHSNKVIEKIKLEIPELPQQKRDRFKKEYGLANEKIEVFVKNKGLGEYFEKIMSKLKNKKSTKAASDYLAIDFQSILKQKGTSIIDKSFPINPEDFAKYVDLRVEGITSTTTARVVLDEMFKTGKDPAKIIKEKELTQITDESEIKKIIQEIVSKNTKAIEDYKNGKEASLQYLVGQVMAASRGKASPQLVQKILKTLLTK